MFYLKGERFFTTYSAHISPTKNPTLISIVWCHSEYVRDNATNKAHIKLVIDAMVNPYRKITVNTTANERLVWPDGMELRPPLGRS